MTTNRTARLAVLRPAAGGEAIAHHDGRTVFVSGAIPGETVDATITGGARGVLRAATVDIVEPSPHRVADRRIALGAPGAGGIEYAHVDLAHSRALKQQAAADQLERIGGIDPAAVGFTLVPAPTEAAATASPATASTPAAPADPQAGTRWRTRVQCAVDPDGRPGMLAAGSHTVVPFGADVIPLAVDRLSALGLVDHRFPGLTRLELAVGADSGAVVLRGPGALAQADAVAALVVGQPGDWSVLVAQSSPPSRSRGRGPRGGRSRGGRNRGGRAAESLVLHSGSGLVQEAVPGLDRTLQVRGDGFWQVHRDAATVLTDAVRTAVGPPADGLVLDLYCGAGLLGIALAEQGHTVLGIEGSAAAVEDARANARGLDARFEVGRVESVAVVPDARVAVLDPPRSGAGAAVVEALSSSAVERIVHVSCDGATLARDLRGLQSAGFRIESVTAHDLFPLTGHLELVAVLKR